MTLKKWYIEKTKPIQAVGRSYLFIRGAPRAKTRQEEGGGKAMREGKDGLCSEVKGGQERSKAQPKLLLCLGSRDHTLRWG